MFFPECQKIPVCPEPWIFRSSRPSSLFTTPTLVPLTCGAVLPPVPLFLPPTPLPELSLHQTKKKQFKAALP